MDPNPLSQRVKQFSPYTPYNLKMDYRVISLDSKEAPGRLDEFVPEVERGDRADCYLDSASWRSNPMEEPGTYPNCYPSSNTLPAKMPRLIRNFDLHGNGEITTRYGRREGPFSIENAYAKKCDRKPQITTTGIGPQREKMEKPDAVSMFVQVY